MEDVNRLPCTTNCRLVEHGQLIYAISTKGSDTEVINLWIKTCANFPKVKTDFGRSAIHAAAATGRVKIVQWLIKNYGVNINLKESRNGHTPLHVALFFGHIHVATELIRLGANFRITSNDGQSPLDLIIKNLPLPEERCRGYEVSVFGANGNFTLGLGKESGRSTPELLDTVRFQNQDGFVVLSAYHSLFIPGGVGIVTVAGTGPRLGIESQCAMVPQPVTFDGTKMVHCIAVATGPDHTIFLMKDGSVWSCGSNENKVLGHDLPSSAKGIQTIPKRIEALSTEVITHVAASELHSVFVTNLNTVYACGYNSGQFGSSVHTAETIQPQKIIPVLTRCTRKIHHISCNEFATIIAWKNDLGLDVLYHNFQKRILVPSGDYSSKAGVLKTEVIGGCPTFGDSYVRTRDKKRKPLVIFILVEDYNTNRVWIYHEVVSLYEVTLSINFKYAYPINVLDMAVNTTDIHVLTNNGEALRAPIDPLYTIAHPFRGDPVQTIKVKRLPNIQRGLKIACSRTKDSSLAIYQWRHDGLKRDDEKVALPEGMKRDIRNLLKDTTLEDSLHDLEFVVKGKVYPAHRYILSKTSPRLYSLAKNASITEWTPGGVTSPLKVDLSKSSVTPHVFEYALRLAYFDAVDLSWLDNPTGVTVEELEWWNTYVGEEEPLKAPLKEPLKGTIKSGVPSDDLADAIFMCSDGPYEFPVHRVMLACRLKYFKIQYVSSTWSKGLRCTGMPMIEIPFNRVTVSYLYNYIYDATNFHSSAFDSLLLEELINIYRMADMFCCDTLRNFVEAEMRRITSHRTVTEFMKIFQMFNIKNMEDYCMEFLLQNLRYHLENRFLETYNADVLKTIGDEYTRRFVTTYPDRFVRPSVEPPSDDAYAHALEPMNQSFLDENELPPNQNQTSFTSDFRHQNSKKSNKAKKRFLSTRNPKKEPSEHQSLEFYPDPPKSEIPSPLPENLTPVSITSASAPLPEEHNKALDQGLNQLLQCSVQNTIVLAFPTLECSVTSKSPLLTTPTRAMNLTKRKVKWKLLELSSESSQGHIDVTESVPSTPEPLLNPWKIHELEKVLPFGIQENDPVVKTYQNMTPDIGRVPMPKGNKIKWKPLEFAVEEPGQPKVMPERSAPQEPVQNAWNVDMVQEVVSIPVKVLTTPLPKINHSSSVPSLPKGKKIKWKAIPAF